MTLPDQTIGLVKKATFPLLFKSEFDGIMGLAYPNRLAQEQNIVPVFDNLIMKGSLRSNIFSIHVTDYGGRILFGSWDENLKEKRDEPFIWVPLAEKNYWTFFIIDMYLIKKTNGKQEILKKQQRMCPKGCKGVIDTGSYFMYGPGSLINVCNIWDFGR